MTISMSLSRSAAAAVASLVLGVTCAHAGSLGKTITVESRFPDALTVNPGFTSTKMIGASGADFMQPDYICSITDTQVTFGRWTTEHTFTDYAFNGTVLKNVGGWSGFSIDRSSTIAGFSADRISIVDGQLRVNFEGLSVDRGSRLALNISAVPEPETYAMLLAGIGMIGVARRRATAAKADSSTIS